jgi:hypothetical protein
VIVEKECTHKYFSSQNLLNNGVVGSARLRC